MIQLSRPRQPFMRGTLSNRDGLASALEVRRPPPPAAPAQFAPGDFFRPIGSIPSDAVSIRSQATYLSGLPPGFSSAFGSARTSSYAPSAATQRDDDASSVAGSIAISQADRLSTAESIMDDDDVRSQARAHTGRRADSAVLDNGAVADHELLTGAAHEPCTMPECTLNLT